MDLVWIFILTFLFTAVFSILINSVILIWYKRESDKIMQDYLEKSKKIRDNYYNHSFKNFKTKIEQ